MDDLDELSRNLRSQREVLGDLLRALNQPGARDPAKNVLALLTQYLDTIRTYRNAWLRLNHEERKGRRDIAELLRENQNLIMRILVLDKEHGQADMPGAQARQAPPAPAALELTGSPLLSRIYRRGAAS